MATTRAKQVKTMRADRLNKKTSQEDVIVKAHDESVRDRSEAVDPPEMVSTQRRGK